MEMKRISILTSLSSLIAILASATTLSVKPAQASLIGDTVNLLVTVLGDFGNIINDSAVVVDPGIEFTNFATRGANLNLDVFDESFDIIANTRSNGSIREQTRWRLSDLDWVDSPGIVTGVSQTGGPNALNISFTDDSITVLLDDVAPGQNQTVTWSFDIQTQHESTPEATSVLGLLALGMFGANSILKRKSS